LARASADTPLTGAFGANVMVAMAADDRMRPTTFLKNPRWVVGMSA